MFTHSVTIERQVFDYHGVVRLLINRSPWRLVLGLRGVAISTAGLTALLEYRDFQNEYTEEDLKKLIRTETEYHLQLELPQDTAGSPVMRAMLRQKEPGDTGLRLLFEFLETSEDLTIFFEELSRRPLHLALS